ncbi:MAG: MurT ligase domain-containing protein [Eubacteriales bacterium]|nr:MurT ligase domain-containing protein [Eubacteriales bacterium]
MRRIRFCIALLAAKCIYFGMRLLRRSATHLPGYFAVKICPDYLKYIDKAKQVICVSGSDGKTTTANLIADLLKNSGYRVASNRIGSNTEAGIAATMTNVVSLLNRCRVDVVVLEVDEHYTRIVCPKVRADYLLVTNLLRDSLQRNAHPEYVFGKINRTDAPHMKVILNADELCSASLLPENPRLYFGIDQLPTDLPQSENLINDCPLCPQCDHKLIGDYVRYAHVGHAHCDHCGYRSPSADWAVTEIDYEKAMLQVRHGEQRFAFPMVNDTLFNIYNEIAAIALLMDMGMMPEKLSEALSNTALTKTRYAEKTVNGVKVINMMAKSNNSLPVSLVFDHIRKYPGKKAVVMALDDLDEKRSSERIGWIYDADYEFLAGEDIGQIIVTGVRCYDHMVRLLLAGVMPEKLVCCQDELSALSQLKKEDIDTVFLLHDMSSYAQSVQAEQKILEVLGDAR